MVNILIHFEETVSQLVHAYVYLHRCTCNVLCSLFRLHMDGRYFLFIARGQCLRLCPIAEWNPRKNSDLILNWQWCSSPMRCKDCALYFLWSFLGCMPVAATLVPLYLMCNYSAVPENYS